MPFTFAHPAAALPLLRPLGRYGSLSALVIGSMAPDLAFFVPVDVTREHTHGPAGLLLFCLPAGALAYLLFHRLLKAPLAGLLPDILQERLGPVSCSPRAPWNAVLVSLLCGASTHIAWDSFTHPGTPVLEALPALQVLLFSVGGYQVFVFKVLQHASSVGGIVVVALAIRRGLRAAPRRGRPAPRISRRHRRRALAAIICGPLLFASWVAARRNPAPADLAELQTAVAAFVFAALPAFAAAVTAYALTWRAWGRWRIHRRRD